MLILYENLVLFVPQLSKSHFMYWNRAWLWLFCCIDLKHQKVCNSRIIEWWADAVCFSACRHTFISDGLFNRFLSELSYSSETLLSRVILTADSDKLGLNIGIRLKNRQTGNFSKSRFFIGHGFSGHNRHLRPWISGLWSFECNRSTVTRHEDTLNRKFNF